MGALRLRDPRDLQQLGEPQLGVRVEGVLGFRFPRRGDRRVGRRDRTLVIVGDGQLDRLRRGILDAVGARRRRCAS